MKNVVLFLLICFTSTLFAQSPDGINYQAVLRDGSGAILKNENVSIDVVIRTKNGANYTETIVTTTNDFGLLNVIIGKNGGVNNLKNTNWASGEGEIELTIQTSQGTINLGTQKFQNVPYAFHAETAQSAINDAVDDADADPNNEIQTISKNANMIELSGNGGSVIDEVNDADADNQNEIQLLSFDNNSGELEISKGNKVTLPLGSGGDNWGSQTVMTDNTLNGNGTSGSILSVNGDLTDDQTLSLNGLILSISGGNDVTLPTGGSSLWKQSQFGIFTEEDAHIGHPDSLRILHLARNSVDFHVPFGNPTSAWNPESLWFEGNKCESNRTADSLEFRDRGVVRSNLSKQRLDFQGLGYQSNMTKNEVIVHGAEIDTYVSNILDSTGFTSQISGFINGSTFQDPFRFRASTLGMSSELTAQGLQLNENQKYVQLGLKSLTFGENGLGSYLNLFGDGFGDLLLLNGANWSAVNATARNDAGEINLYDISGRSNLYFGYRNGFKGTGSILSLHNNKVTSFSSTADSGAGFSQIYGPNGKVNVAITSRILNPNHGSISIIDANGDAQAGIYVDPTGKGVVWGDMKNFVTEHPEKEDTDIWYGSLEGPEIASYERGTAKLLNGKLKVLLSDHFRAMSNTNTMTVILTPHSADTYGLAVIQKGQDSFTVKELKNGHGNFSFDWEVKCVRKGYENWRVERPAREKENDIVPINQDVIQD